MGMLKSVKALRKFLIQTPRIWNAHNDKPATNSKAALELFEYERPISIQTAYSQASFLFEAGVDYAWAVGKTLTEPFLAIAPWACARGVLSTSALATWLWDIKIDARQRAERSIAFRCEGLKQEYKFALASKGRFNPAIVSKRLAEVKEIANKLGFTKTVTKKGKSQTVLIHPMPFETDVIIDMLDKEVDYRLLSAMVHGHTWAIQPLSFGKIADQQETSNLSGSIAVVKNISPVIVRFLCSQTLISLSAPILMKFKLFGWDSKQMEKAFMKAILEIKAS